MWAKHAVLRPLLRVSLCLALAGAALGAPSPQVAEASTMSVDRNDDAGDAAAMVCENILPNDCSLRGAIQVANTNGVTDIINFMGNRAIVLTSTLVLTATGTTIQATSLQTVTIAASNIAFRIRANDITLDRLRVYGAVGATNIWISDTAQRIKIANNVIGDQAYGFLGACGDSPSSTSGIFISSSAVPTGTNAVAWIYGNSIKCIGGGPGDGIQIVGAREVVIGADAVGNATSAQANLIMLNDGNGVYLTPSATLNTIRNSDLQYNDGSGLVIDGDSNVVYGNYFQVNGANGIELRAGAALNQIGCPLGTLDPDDEDLRNVIHQNAGNGILITGAGANSNQIFCNWIGVGDDGANAAPNLGHGVRIEAGASFNLVGASQGTGNVISGNAASGVRITGAGTNNNLVRGNRIGTNATGAGPVPNQIDGVQIISGASLNTVGGPAFAYLNLIAGNGVFGVYISGSGTATNTVTYNDIGYNSGNGLPIPNGLDGLTLQNSTHHNVIGGAGLNNYSAYNLGNGLSLKSGAQSNSISVNSIFSNTRNGVLLDGTNTGFNVITGTVIFNNGEDGIAERASAGLNNWLRLSIYANGGLGVDKNAVSPSSNIIDGPFPTITSVNPGTGQIAGTASDSAFVEVYLAYPDVSGHGEGKTFVASTISNGSGAWSLTVPLGTAGCFTAVEIVGFIIYESSEFGPNTCLQLFVPVLRR